MDQPQICECIPCIELLLVICNQCGRYACNNAVIHMNCKDEGMFSSSKVEDSRVCLHDIETKVSEGMHKGIIPSLASLLESIKRLVQPLDAAITFLVAWGLLHVNVFSLTNLSIEVRAIEVKGINLPVVGHSNCEDESNAGYLGHRGVGVRNRQFLVPEIGSSVSRSTKAYDKFGLVRADDIVYWKTSEIRGKEGERSREFKRVTQNLEDKIQACIADLGKYTTIYGHVELVDLLS
jgi:hypothetical protein